MPKNSRVRKNSQSVLAIYAFLADVIRQPSSFITNASLRSALKSQGALAKWNDEELGIFASSINTVKRIANAALQGGFCELDRVRVSALEAIETEASRSHQPIRQTKAGLAIQKSNLEQELQQALQDLWHLTAVTNRALSLWQKCAEQTNNSSVIALCKREQRELRARLSLCELPVVKQNIDHNDATA